MVSTEDYRLFVQALNRGFRNKHITTEDEFMLIASLELRLMPPSKAKQVIKDVLNAKIVTAKGDYILLDNLWNGKEYVVKSQKTGKVLKSKVERPANAPKRTVRYVEPGHTIVGYEHRTLHIRFPETKKEFDARAKARRRAAARNRSHSNAIYVDRDESGGMRYVTRGGSSAGLRARSTSDKGRKAIVRKELAKDTYTIEDMRAR